MELESDEEVNQLLTYLKKFYLPDQNIEDWYKSKSENFDKSEGIGKSILINSSETQSSIENFKPYSKETYYYY